MSHNTHIKTRFQNLFYLEKALNRLNILHNRQEKIVGNSNTHNINIIIPQLNKHNIEFIWNGQEYELIVDISFWKQSSTVESFIDKIAQQYALASIIGESQKMGWQQINYSKSLDGSNLLVLERWKD